MKLWFWRLFYIAWLVVAIVQFVQDATPMAVIALTNASLCAHYADHVLKERP